MKCEACKFDTEKENKNLPEWERKYFTEITQAFEAQQGYDKMEYNLYICPVCGTVKGSME